MQCEKAIALQATSDSEHLIADSFMLDGQLTDLYLYRSELRLMQKNKNRNIPLQFSLNFAIVKGENGSPVGLQFYYGEEKLRLERDFWPRANEWENLLLNFLIRKDFHEFFKPLRKIGKGNFATVYLAEDLRANRYVAVKAFMKEPAFKNDGRAAIENEIKLMRRIKNQNIVQLHGVYETKNSLYLSMEYIEGISLDAYIRRNKDVTVEQRRKIMKGLLNGIKQLNKLRIVHRDLKPQNIMVSQNCQKIKIVDFGLATNIDEPEYIFVRCGTPGFVAPEILRIRDVEQTKLGVQSDMFSLGSIYYNLIYGYPLFPGKDQNEVLSLNRHCKVKLSPKQGLGYGQMELLCGMLQHDPCSRITPEQALKNVFCRALQPIQNESVSSWIFEDK